MPRAASRNARNARNARKKTTVDAETARRILLALPGVEEGPCYGTAGFRVRKKFLARLRDDDEVLVVKCGFDERDVRLRADPETFFTTDHYRGYPTVLVRGTHERRSWVRARGCRGPRGPARARLAAVGPQTTDCRARSRLTSSATPNYMCMKFDRICLPCWL